MLYPKANLGEPSQDNIFTEVTCIVLLLGSDNLTKVSSINIVHYDVQITLACLVDLPKPNDIGMLEYPHNFSFLVSSFLLVLCHSLCINKLDTGVFTIRLCLHQKNFSVSSSAQQ